MQMQYFHIAQNITILFKSWHVNASTELLLYLVLIFACAILLECLRAVQTNIVIKLHTKVRRVPMTARQLKILRRQRLIKHAAASLIYMLQLTCSYFLMLVVMTYDSRIMATVIAGLLVGYYLADPLIVRDTEISYLQDLADSPELSGENRRLAAAETGKSNNDDNDVEYIK